MIICESLVQRKSELGSYNYGNFWFDEFLHLPEDPANSPFIELFIFFCAIYPGDYVQQSWLYRL